MLKRSIIVSLVAFVALLFTLLGTNAVTHAQGEIANLKDLGTTIKGDPKLESTLDQLTSTSDQIMTSAFASQHGLSVEDNKVRVIIEVNPRNEDDFIGRAKVLGADVETTYENLVQAVVPIPQLKTLADDVNVTLVRLPLAATPTVVSEGAGIINANQWQTGGFSGSGVKIGILDQGFSGYSSLLGTDLPSTVTTWWAPSIGGPGTEVHGTACAEIVYDIAPDAQFYLANFETDVEWNNAVNWLIGQGVKVISCSVVWANSGPGNGTGSICNTVTTARNAGILWSQSAGNFAQTHWSGTFLDNNGDGWHKFNLSPVDETNMIYANAGDTISVFLKWDDPWGASTDDYDLYLFNASLNRVDYSNDVQNGNGCYPREEIEYVAPTSGYYYIAIGKYSATRNVFFHLITFRQDLRYQVASGSLLEPADSPNAMTVGAVPWYNPNYLEAFSSQGPTTDGRIKPDLAGIDYVSTVTYGTSWGTLGGGFGGTSAAAPHGAGAAALVKGRFPSYTPAQIQNYLETNTVDLGATGKDNLYGSGRLFLPSRPQIAVSPVSKDFGIVSIGLSSSPQTFTVSNTGTANLLVGTITITGADAAQFTLQNDNCSGKTIGAGSLATLQVVFSPISAGAKMATLSIPSNDSSQPTVTISLAGAAAKLAFTTQPSSSNTAGTPFNTQPVVKVQDASGNTITSSAAQVTLAITLGTGNSGATLSGTKTVNAISGVATFSGLSIDLAGTDYTLTATSPGLASATSATFSVNLGAAMQVRVETMADGTGTFVAAQDVTADSHVTGYAITRDAGGNFLANVAGTWSLVNKTGGAVDGDLVANGDNKSAIFTGHLMGTANIHVTYDSLTSNDSGSLNVVAGDIDHYSVSHIGSLTGSLQARGLPFNVTIQAQDYYNNNVTIGSETVSITFGKPDAGATPTSTTTTNGTATISNMTMTVAQTGQTITFNGLTSGKSGTTNSFDVVEIDHYSVSAVGSPKACGWPFGVTIQAEDASGNDMNGGSETVNITYGKTDGGATPTSTITINGMATVSMTLTVAQTGQTIIFTGASGKKGTSNSFDVIIGALITGSTYEVKGLILPNTTVTLIKDNVTIATAMSDSQGNYTIIAPEPGNYLVNAIKTGFKKESQSINIGTLGQEYTLNFKGQHGIIPNAPDIWYLLDCAALWKYPPADPELGLDIWRLLDVAAAWKYPK